MEPSVVSDFFSAQVRSLKKDYRSLNDRQEEQIIHDLRIDIKKIRFILNLTSRYDSPASFKKLYQPFKKLFEQAGKLRDADIKQQLLKKYFGIAASKDNAFRLKKEEQHTQKKLQKEFSDFKDELKKAKNKATRKMKKLSAISAAVYAHDLLEELKNCFHADMKDEELHASRKLLKEITYASKLNEELNAGLEAEKLQPLKMKYLEKQIGSWHDKTIFSEWLNQDGLLSNLPASKKEKTIAKLNRDIRAGLRAIHSRIGKLHALHS